ncbi:MAG: hypothetical protein WCS55_10640 [Sulfuricurvum sp.]|uniref:hypothetical protein n=1 Tax=Sulfuricurvum sp. TaxID=2025608 RepID=UPI00356388B1
MKIDSNVLMNNNVILKNLQNYLVFNGKLEEYQTFISNNNEIKLSSDISQFIIMYDEDKKIIFAKNFELLMKPIEKIDISCNILKGILTILKNRKRLNKCTESKYQLLKNENISNIIKIDNNIQIVILEIPLKKRFAIKELQETLEWFLKNDYFKFQVDIEENLGFVTIPKLFFVAYLSLIVGTVIRVLDIFPLNIISLNDVILAVKILLSVFLSTGSILLLLTAIIFYFGYRFPDFYSKYNIFFYGPKIVKTYLIGFSLLTLFSSFHYNVYPKLENIFLAHIYKWSANFYINSKTLMVYDYDFNKTIIYLDTKDRMYYYYDSFDINMTKIDTNETEKIKEIILGTHETNNTKNLLHGHWKMNYIKELKFDYNDTLILKALSTH